MVKILKIEMDSIAMKVGILPGDFLVSINGHEINDLIDLKYYVADETINVRTKRDGQFIDYEIEKDYDDELGIVIEDFEVRSCNNNCIFCFAMQNPPGLRKALYFKDEDYRLSFLYGNYITMTNLEESDLERIVRMRLSPLYISVHATDKNLRKKIFQRDSDDYLFDKLDYLMRGEIELHAQIVLMPGINDGEALEKTISDLYHYKSSIKSVAIVPVGLTKFRKNRYKLTPVDSEYARKLIRCSKNWTKNYFNSEGNKFVYLSDEIFLLANRTIPVSSYYGFYYQLDNGVGLTRYMLDEFRKIIKKLPKKIKGNKRALFVTGVLARSVLNNYVISYLNTIDGLHVDTVSVINNFFGDSITVSGLLAGVDIVEQLKDIVNSYDVIVLPPRCINEDCLFIDDMTIEDIERELGKKVIVFNENFFDLINHVQK
ncbi:MAG: DUF512 domain-containing protein [Candidatus Marinimicrobia bacterium]|nr:DUF512 domain-containing protein [Candidatus Neomarinimicrobiota bacterium]